MVARRILVPPVGVRIPPRQQTQPSGCVLSYIDPAPGAMSFRGVGRAPDGSHTVQWSDAAPRCRHTSGWCNRLIYSKLVGTQKFLRPRPDGHRESKGSHRPMELCHSTGRCTTIRLGTQKFLRPYKTLKMKWIPTLDSPTSDNFVNWDGRHSFVRQPSGSICAIS